MKFSYALLPIFSVLAVAAPVTESRRQEVTIETLVTGLTSQVTQITSHINQTLATLSADADAALKQTVIATVNQDLKAITSAFRSTNSQVSTAGQKQTLGDLPADILGQLDGKPIVLANLVLPLLQELDPTLQSVLATLSLGEVYVALQPLLSTELPALVSGLSPLVSGLLDALSPLLSGLGGLLGPILLDLDL